MNDYGRCPECGEDITPELTDAKADAYNEALRQFAWWKDGVQYVGTCGTTLQEAERENPYD